MFGRSLLLTGSRHARPMVSRIIAKKVPAKPTSSTAVTSGIMDTPPTRFFASKNKNKSKGGGGQSGGGVTLAICWGDPEDEEFETDDLAKFKKMPSMGDIYRKFEDYAFSDEDSLEYYKGGEWHELNNPAEQLKSGLKKPILIRPSGLGEYDEEEYDEEGYDEEDDLGFDTSEYNKFEDDAHGIKEKIYELVENLQENKTAILPTEEGGVSQLKMGDGTTMSTRKYVLNEAENDKQLQNLLLNKIGCLDHIVQVSYFPMHLLCIRVLSFYHLFGIFKVAYCFPVHSL